MLDLNKLGYSYYKIHLKYKKINQEILKKIKNYLHFNSNIVYKTETIGGPDLEFEIQAINNKEMYTILDKFIKEFEGIIEDYEILEYEKEYKLSYLNVIWSIIYFILHITLISHNGMLYNWIVHPQKTQASNHCSWNIQPETLKTKKP